MPDGDRPITALLALWATTATGVVIVACSFLPWGGSGQAQRSSWELLRAAERLDVLHGLGQEVGAVAWHLAPLAVAAMWLAAVWRRPLVVAALGAAVGALAVGFALTVRASPVRAEIGVGATIVAGGLAVLTAALTAWTRKELA